VLSMSERYYVRTMSGWSTVNIYLYHRSEREATTHIKVTSCWKCLCSCFSFRTTVQVDVDCTSAITGFIPFALKMEAVRTVEMSALQPVPTWYHPQTKFTVARNCCGKAEIWKVSSTVELESFNGVNRAWDCTTYVHTITKVYEYNLCDPVQLCK
jgi:hypothetical protein